MNQRIRLLCACALLTFSTVQARGEQNSMLPDRRTPPSAESTVELEKKNGPEPALSVFFNQAKDTHRFILTNATAARTVPRSTTPENGGGAIEVTSGTKTISPDLRGQLEQIVARHRGVMGISLRNLDTSETLSINGQELFPTASTIKLAVMTAVFERLCAGEGPSGGYYQTCLYDGSTSASGSGFLRQFRTGQKVELKELLHFMITVSDNTATNMLVEWLGGLTPINDWLQRHGFEATRINSTVGGRIVGDPELRKKWGLGVTTPDEMRELMEMIVSGKAGTTSTTDEMMRLLGHQYFDDGIASQVPPTVWVGSKSGSVNDSRSDVAVVASPGGTYVLSVYTKNNEDKRWTRENEAEQGIRAVSKAVWQHYNPTSTWSRPAGAENF